MTVPELETYTSDELIEELINREPFGGVVVWSSPATLPQTIPKAYEPDYIEKQEGGTRKKKDAHTSVLARIHDQLRWRL